MFITPKYRSDAGIERKEIYCAFRYGSFVLGYVHVTYEVFGSFRIMSVVTLI